MFRLARAIGARRYSRPVRVLITGGGGFLGSHLVSDTTKPNGQPRRRLDVSRSEELEAATE
jgi:nucleoside-diphosphate-sugar epimerase